MRACQFDPSRDAVVSFYELALLLGMIATAVTVLLARTEADRRYCYRALGFLVVFVFVLFRAPDLALTQLVVKR